MQPVVGSSDRADGGTGMQRYTMGRDHIPEAVRKAEAWSPAAYPLPQVAAEPEARVFATSGA